MRILVTGATGFAGRWLLRDLEANGHVAVPTPPSSTLDIADEMHVAAFIADARPDAIAHLAGVAYGPDARRDLDKAMAVNEGGTRAILAAAAAGSRPVPVMLVSSSEVYGSPSSSDLPLTEMSSLRTDQPYGRSKLAQERAAFEAIANGMPAVVVRPFNHIGPGQRAEFVVPALARRVIAAHWAGDHEIGAGNVDVRRDFTDVRDVVRAYRLILEALVAGALPDARQVYNVASGRSVAVRDIASAFGRRAGVEIAIRIDPELVRSSDPTEIRGDASAIAAELGWRTQIEFTTTLRDIFDDAERLMLASADSAPAR